MCRRVTVYTWCVCVCVCVCVCDVRMFVTTLQQYTALYCITPYIVYSLPVCREGEIPCLGSEDDPVCVSEDDVCDGVNQCPDSFDELNCGE